MLAAKSFSPLIVEINLSKQLSHVMDVYEFPFKIMDENKCFQYKIIHSITLTNLSLYKMNINQHVFLECPITLKSFKPINLNLRAFTHGIIIFFLPQKISQRLQP